MNTEGELARRGGRAPASASRRAVFLALWAFATVSAFTVALLSGIYSPPESVNRSLASLEAAYEDQSALWPRVTMGEDDYERIKRLLTEPAESRTLVNGVDPRVLVAEGRRGSIPAEAAERVKEAGWTYVDFTQEGNRCSFAAWATNGGATVDYVVATMSPWYAFLVFDALVLVVIAVILALPSWLVARVLTRRRHGTGLDVPQDPHADDPI